MYTCFIVYPKTTPFSYPTLTRIGSAWPIYQRLTRFHRNSSGQTPNQYQHIWNWRVVLIMNSDGCSAYFWARNNSHFACFLATYTAFKTRYRKFHAKLLSSMPRVFFIRLEHIHRSEPGLYLPSAHSQVLLSSAPTSALLLNISCSVARRLPSLLPSRYPAFVVCNLPSYGCQGSPLYCPPYSRKKRPWNRRGCCIQCPKFAPAQWNQGGV